MYDNTQIYEKIWGHGAEAYPCPLIPLMLVLHVNIVILLVFATIIYCYNIDIFTHFVYDCNPRSAPAT